jgi:hypothetical protein
MSEFSTFLFPKSSALEGAARVWDFGGCLTAFNRSTTPELADENALRADWLAVGADIRAAMDQFAKESHVQARPAQK